MGICWEKQSEVPNLNNRGGRRKLVRKRARMKTERKVSVCVQERERFDKKHTKSQIT
jgi:hypothetical protein